MAHGSWPGGLRCRFGEASASAGGGVPVSFRSNVAGLVLIFDLDDSDDVEKAVLTSDPRYVKTV